MSKQSKQFYEFGPFRIDPLQRVLFREGKPVALPPKIFGTLLALVERSGQIVEKDKLLEEVWPETVVEENNLTQYISALRKTLGDGRHEQRYIETIPRRGYRFAAEVQEVRGESDELTTGEQTVVRLMIREETEELIEEQTSQVVEAGAASSPARPLNLKPAYLAVIALAVALAAVILWTVVKTRTAEPTVQGRGFAGSIAVLPFKTLNASENDLYLGLGLADALITELGSLKQITVRPTSAVQKYVGSDYDPTSVGRELEVDLVLEGRVQQSGDRIRVTVQLISTRDGSTTWSDKFDGRFQDLLAAQDSISNRVVHALQLNLSIEEKRQLVTRHSESSEAYQTYMMGRYYWSRRTPEGHLKARRYFEQAIALDPGYALAYAGLAGTLSMAPNETTIEQRERLAIKALGIDETLAEPHATLGFINLFQRHNWAGAEQELKRALELNPNYATAHQWYAIYLETQGRLDEAERHMRRALEIDPLSLAINADLGELLYFRRDYNGALEQCLKTLDMDPTFGFTHYYLEKIYTQKGMHAEVADHLFKRIQFFKLPVVSPKELASMRQAFAKTGVRGLWQAHNRAYYDRFAGTSEPDWVASAMYHALLGETEQALDCLEKGGFHIVFVKVEPAYDSLRSDPRFKELLNRLGLSE
jgi:DNA-binding winged helix-turn-helix (wHTH) protein/TolB-like protein/Tfp pilus assembly protein PilF